MTPYDLAEHLPCQGWDIDAAIVAHFMRGWVVSTPDFIFMARIIWKDWPDAARCDLTAVDPAGDTIWIWCLAGDLSKVALYFHLLPAKKWVAFARRDSPRFWRYDRFRSSLSRHAGQSLVKDAAM